MYLAAVYLWVWRPTDAPRARRYSRTPLTLTSGVCLRVRVGGISDVFGGGRRVRAVTGRVGEKTRLTDSPRARL